MSYRGNFIEIQFSNVPDDFKASDEVDKLCSALNMHGKSYADDVSQTIACTGSATSSLSYQKIARHWCIDSSTPFTVKGEFRMTKDQIIRLGLVDFKKRHCQKFDPPPLS